jgi:hypothetical protein
MKNLPKWPRGHSRERCALWHSGRDAQRLTFRHGSSRGTDAGRSGLLRYWLYSRMRNVGGGNAVCAQQVVMAHFAAPFDFRTYGSSLFLEGPNPQKINSKAHYGSARQCRSSSQSIFLAHRNRNGIQRVARALNFQMPDGLSPHTNKKLAGTDSGVVCRLGAYSIRTNGDAPTYVRVYTLPGTQEKQDDERSSADTAKTTAPR